MITIDMLDEHVSLPVKPNMKHHAPEMLKAPGGYVPLHTLALEHHRELLENAHQVRLLKASRARQLAAEMLHSVEKIQTQVFTLAERYARRSAHPLGR